MNPDEIIRAYAGKGAAELSKEELEFVEGKLKASANCKECGFCYQYNKDIKALAEVKNMGYNTVFIQILCQDRYTITGSGFKCDFEQVIKDPGSFGLENCPKCSKPLAFTVMAMNVNVSGLVESFCPKCGGMISSARPFERV